MKLVLVLLCRFLLLFATRRQQRWLLATIDDHYYDGYIAGWRGSTLAVEVDPDGNVVGVFYGYEHLPFEVINCDQSRAYMREALYSEYPDRRLHGFEWSNGR